MDSKCKNRNYFQFLSCVFVIFSLIPHLLLAQYHFDFETDSSNGPDFFPGSSWKQLPKERWKRSTEGAIEGVYSLRHDFDNHEGGCDYLIFNHHSVGDSDSLVFSFRVRHGYAPSSSNNWQLAMLADFQDESMQIQKGIVLGVNFTGSDDLIRIWECDEGIPVEICVTPISYQEEVGTDAAPLFRLVCYRDGLLRLFYTRDPSLEEPVPIASSKLDFLPMGRQLVIRYEYSSARDRNLWIDQVILDGDFEKDSIAPQVTGVMVISEKELELSFSENILNPSQGVFLLGSKRPGLISGYGKKVLLTFPDPLPNRSPLEMRIGNVCDVDQNCLRDTLIGFMRNEAVFGDVVFNEILADPDPPIRLPDEEYLEIFNRSDYASDIKEWRLEVNSRTYSLKELLPQTTDTSAHFLILEPSSFLVLKGMTLPNEMAVLALYNEQGSLVHGVSYQVPWDAMDWKKEGGWSLESPDPHLYCMVSNSWEYSSDPSGGTPGRENSNKHPAVDREPPVLLYYGYGETGELFLQYSETLRLTDLESGDFIVRPGTVMPIKFCLRDPLKTILDLKYPEDLRDRQHFTLDLPVLCDCQGNRSLSQKIKGGKVKAPSYETLVINEIMYDPPDGFPEYVELYNPGPDYFDLQELALHVVEEGAVPDHPRPLSTQSRIILPGQYLVLTASVPHLRDSYGLAPSGSWVELESLPQMKNTGGSLYLTDRSGAVVDQAIFRNDLHMDLLDDTRGISLERISWERSGNDPANWHSAASISGYATPGTENSQLLVAQVGEEVLEIEPLVFSPDNDGFQDLLKITISTGAQGWVLSLWVSDLGGRMIRSLANNHIAAPSVLYSWDGEEEDGGLVSAGIYVLHLLVYHPLTGDRYGKKAAIGVIYR